MFLHLRYRAPDPHPRNKPLFSRALAMSLMAIVDKRFLLLDEISVVDPNSGSGSINDIRTRVAPDTDLAGYPANIFARYPVGYLAK